MWQWTLNPESPHLHPCHQSDSYPNSTQGTAPPQPEPGTSPKRRKPDPKLKPQLIMQTTGAQPRSKRTLLADLTGFAREARLRENYCLNTAYTTARGYFKVPSDRKDRMDNLKKMRKQIRHYQTSQEILIPPLPFVHLVREIFQDVVDDIYDPKTGTLPPSEMEYFRICPEAIFALQEACGPLPPLPPQPPLPPLVFLCFRGDGVYFYLLLAGLLFFSVQLGSLNGFTLGSLSLLELLLELVSCLNGHGASPGIFLVLCFV